MKWNSLLIYSFLLTGIFTTASAQDASLLFDVNDASAPVIQPWKVIPLDQDYGGLWAVAGDVDNDGQPEIVSSENYNENDVHYTTTAVAQKLDGSILWKWGDPDVGRKIWHHDVACQIHDWDGDGNREVVLLTKKHLVELDGATGQEKRRFPIPEGASDCLVFCDLSGKGRATDVLVKNRYRQIWAFNHAGDLLWTVKDPGGFRTSHQPRPVDLDGDGRDEIMAGYAMLNSDGSVRWVFQSQSVDQSRGHLDCMRVVREGRNPDEFRLALTCCGANNIAMVDGNGKVLWEKSGYHFESINVGYVIPGEQETQILVDIDHKPLGESPLWLLDASGVHLGRIVSDYCRHHKLLDWTGDGFDEIFVAHNRAVYDGRGRRIASLAKPQRSSSAEKGEDSLLLGDMTGDGVQDVLLITPESVSIFKNEHGKKPNSPAPLGTGLNVTLY
ncbi:MAG: hypothetical protein JXR73_02660 [Candidatus Omnitrophica bacterium]|nr:hypothetical protein [Candidatus Omnitrophota bacterium]